MIAIEGNFAYSFVLGVLAAVNPCGFVLLPTYLLFFLGTREEPNLGTSERLGRALKVSAGVPALSPSARLKTGHGRR